MARKWLNNLSLTLDGAILSGGTSIVVAGDDALLDALDFAGGDTIDLTLESGTTREIVTVTANPSAKTYTVTRGVDSTTPSAFPDGATIECRVTRQQLEIFGAGGGAPALTRTTYAQVDSPVTHVCTGKDLIVINRDDLSDFQITLDLPAGVDAVYEVEIQSVSHADSNGINVQIDGHAAGGNAGVLKFLGADHGFGTSMINDVNRLIRAVLHNNQSATQVDGYIITWPEIPDL